MKLYLINLDRRPDRLAAMEGEARKARVSFIRLAAVDGETQTGEAAATAWFTPSGPVGALSRGEKCCTLSHRAAWEALVQSGDSHAVILEDDVRLSPAAAALLADDSWVPDDVSLIKLEHYGPPQQRLLVTDEIALPVGRGLTLGRMASRHTGSGAYLISRRAAQILLSVERFTLPIDHLLFNPNNSPVFAALKPWQLLPAVARQHDFVGQHSDLQKMRLPKRYFSPAYWKREIVRGAYELRLLPLQLWLLFSGRGWIVEVGHGGRKRRAAKPSPMPAE